MKISKEEINALFEKFNSLTALVVGDVMIDAYYWGQVDRISPEAPVPVLQVNKIESRLGGAANVALNVQSLGATPVICSVVGDGSKGNLLRKILKEGNFSTEGIIDSAERKTTIKTRIISGGQHMLRIDEEITTPLNATDERNLLECIKAILAKQKVDVVIFEDYNKGVLTPRVIETVIGWANEKNIVTAVDPKKQNFFAYKNVTLFKPNLKELQEGLKSDFEKSDVAALKKAVNDLEKKLANRVTLVTLSDQGMMAKEGNEVIHEPAHLREILDVSGAGDTVIAVAALALAAGAAISTLTTLSNLAGGMVCENVGVVPVNKAQLNEEVLKQIA